jgi:hypothetical protein
LAAYDAQPTNPTTTLFLGIPAISDFGPLNKASRAAENAEGPPAQKATSVTAR